MESSDSRWFEECFDAIYQFVGVLDGHGKIIKVNRAALAMTGLESTQIEDVPLWSIPWKPLTRENKRLLRRAVSQASKGEFFRNELEIHRRDQPDMVIDFSLKPILDDQKTLRFMIAEGRDITVYRRTREALYQSEARFRTIFREAGIGIVIKAVDGKMLDCNPAFLNMLGYTASELFGRTYLEITHPLDRSISQKLFNELVSGKRKSYFLEKRYLHKDGEMIWGRFTSSLVRGRDEKPRFIIGMVENITAQKQIENELVELQRRLMRGREMERLQIAQDLHDGPLQQIIAVSYQVQELENSLGDKVVNEQLQSVRAALHDLTRSIRNICGDLRPPTLAPFGLEKTIRSHVEEFQSAHPEVAVDLDLAHDGLTLPEHIRIVLFRIYQEAFNNILRHAQASRVEVLFQLSEEQAVLEVRDNGVGFDLPGHWLRLARQGHLGLVGAMERAKEVGGSLEVISGKRQGTLLRASVPIHEELPVSAGEEERK